MKELFNCFQYLATVISSFRNGDRFINKSQALCLIVLSQFALFTITAACQSVDEPSLEMTVDAILADHTGNDKPGATIGIIKDGKLIFQKGYGMANLQSLKANGANISYNIASGSKQFTAVAVASLIEQNKLALTDTIGKFIPEFPDYGKPVTIENLLYHTSGIRDYMVLLWLTGKSFEEDFNNQDALDVIVRQNKLNFTLGDRCVYSNSNYILLAEIIRRITGKTLALYAHDTVFKKLNMKSSGFDRHDIEKKTVDAFSYFKSETGYMPFKNNYVAYGDGGLHTTLEDLTLWDKEFYDSSSLTRFILKRGSLSNGNKLSYGMGIIMTTYRNEIIQSHPGAFLGFRSEILRFPAKNISIICLGNAEDINPETITRAIADAYVFGDPLPQKQLHRKTNLPLDDEIATTFTGIYEVAPNVFIHIRYDKGMLTGQVSGQPSQQLYATGDYTFSIGATNDNVVFENIVDGKSQRLTVMQKQGNTIAQRLDVLSSEGHHRYTGLYYSKEQNTTYEFYAKDDKLWFKVGTNADVETVVLTKYNRAYFDYKNLEQAVIDFRTDNSGLVNSFLLSTGRVNGIEFLKKQ